MRQTANKLGPLRSLIFICMGHVLSTVWQTLIIVSDYYYVKHSFVCVQQKNSFSPWNLPQAFAYLSLSWFGVGGFRMNLKQQNLTDAVQCSNNCLDRWKTGLLSWLNNKQTGGVGERFIGECPDWVAHSAGLDLARKTACHDLWDVSYMLRGHYSCRLSLLLVVCGIEIYEILIPKHNYNHWQQRKNSDSRIPANVLER